MSKKKTHRHVLTLDEDFEFETFGLCSHHPDYRVAFNLNEVLDIQLQKAEEDFKPEVKKGTAAPHSIYEFINEDFGAFYLIKNQSQGKFLIPEKPQVDFFLFVNQLNGVNERDLMHKINQVSIILGTFYFESDELPSLKNIHLDF
ncbi:MAG: IPExxxVDY family protein [Crocinitomicaceae bacterium]|jgi:hypothetical protein|nr:IPExxxVDY family protein [Crocinitomicaceae bacterium]